MKKVTIFKKKDILMKKICNYSLSILAGCALLAACTKENSNHESMRRDFDRNEEVPAGTTFIKVILPDAAAKVSLTQDAGDANGNILLAWESTDQIQVIDAADATNCATFTIQDGYTAHEATFSGDAVTAGSYHILYGADNVAAANEMEYASQRQSGNASTAHLHYVALLEGVDSYEEVQFTDEWAAAHGGTLRQSGVLRLRIRLPEAITTASECTLTASEAIFYTSNAGTATTDRLTLNFDNNAAVGSDHVLAAYAVLPWKDVAVADGTVFEVIYDTVNAIQFEPIALGGIREDPSEQAMIAACLVLEGAETVGDSLYFVNPDYADTWWFDSALEQTARIGNHNFYSERSE